MLDIKVIVFDLDGVLIESADIKTEAFRELFAGYTAHIDEIIQYHIEKAGISRYVKFKFIYESFIKEAYNSAIEKKLDQRFKNLVLDKIIICPYVNGTIEFLNRYCKTYPLYIVSGTPDDELKEIVKKKSLDYYFYNIFGSSKTKSEWLEMIIKHEKIQPNNLLFIGDAMSDYQAALTVRTLFIGRCNGNGDNIFPEENTLAIIDDLRELALFVESNDSSK